MKKQAILLCFLMIFTSVILCGCGGKTDVEAGNGDLTEVTFVLDWTPNTNHTGIYVAQEKGWFEEEGLAVELMQPPENGVAMLVASGSADLGIDFQDYLADAFAAEDPLPVTAVAAILQHNTSGILSSGEDDITSPGKMENHTYATWKLPIEQAILKQVVTEDGGNFDKIEQIPTTVTDVIAALNADIDSVWVYYGVEGIACDYAGQDTDFFYFTDIDDVFDFYSPVIIANDDYLEKHPETVRAFLRAVKKGYEYAAEHPGEAAKILCAAVPELDPELTLKGQKWISPRYIDDAPAWGIIDGERWNRFYGWLNENDLLECDIPADYGFTNDYLK